MEIIQDGTGTGHKVKVDSENRLHSKSISTTLEHDINSRLGLAFHLLFEQTPTGADDCFLYIKNEDQDKNLIIEGVSYRVASVEQIETYLNDTGTPSGGTSIIPANNKAGESNNPFGDFQSGNDIVGLTKGSKIEKLYLTNTDTKHFNFEQDIILPPNRTFTLRALTGSIQISGTVVFHYANLE